VKRLVLALALVGCSGAPLPTDLERAQGREAARDDAGALAAYRAVRLACEAPGATPRPHDDCGLATVREAQLLEKLDRPREAQAAWLRVPARSSDRRKVARALVRAAQLAEDLGDGAGAERIAWRAVETYPDEMPADDALALAVRLGARRDPRALAARLDALQPRLARFDIGDNLAFARAELARTALDDAPDAVARYDHLADAYPHSGLRDDALWRAAELLRAAGDARGALARLQHILDTHKDAFITGSYNSIYLDDAQLLYGRICLEDLHDPARAADAFENLADDFKDSTLRDDALYELARARLARHTPPGDGDRRDACAALARLFREYPDGNRVTAGRTLARELGCP
jgi:tetratricopeptide (TPR) repeat protein